MKNHKYIQQFIDDALSIEVEDARSAGQLGFLARAMVMATLPIANLMRCTFSVKMGYLRWQ